MLKAGKVWQGKEEHIYVLPQALPCWRQARQAFVRVSVAIFLLQRYVPSTTAPEPTDDLVSLTRFGHVLEVFAQIWSFAKPSHELVAKLPQRWSWLLSTGVAECTLLAWRYQLNNCWCSAVQEKRQALCIGMSGVLTHIYIVLVCINTLIYAQTELNLVCRESWLLIPREYFLRDCPAQLISKHSAAEMQWEILYYPHSAPCQCMWLLALCILWNVKYSELNFVQINWEEKQEGSKIPPSPLDLQVDASIRTQDL